MLLSLVCVFFDVLGRLRRLRSRVFTAQKAFGFDVLPDLVRRFRIERLHFFDLFSSQLRQVSYEMHETPAVVASFLGPRAPAGHSGQANTVLDYVEQLMVVQLLRCRQPHVRSAGIQASAHLGIAAPVITMTGRTVIGEMRPAGSDWVLRLRNRVRLTMRVPAARHFAYCARQTALDAAGFAPRADTDGHEVDANGSAQHRGGNCHGSKDLERRLLLHLRLTAWAASSSDSWPDLSRTRRVPSSSRSNT